MRIARGRRNHPEISIHFAPRVTAGGRSDPGPLRLNIALLLSIASQSQSNLSSTGLPNKATFQGKSPEVIALREAHQHATCTPNEM